MGDGINTPTPTNATHTRYSTIDESHGALITYHPSPITIP
jgi:hypothetical protein